MANAESSRAPANRTMTLSAEEISGYKTRLSNSIAEDVRDKIVCDDVFRVLPQLPDASVDLMFADPPYNLNKSFNERQFRKTSIDEYSEWLDSWLSQTVRILKPTASVYICGDWRCSTAIHRMGEKYFIPQNRIT